LLRGGYGALEQLPDEGIQRQAVGPRVIPAAAQDIVLNG
jgi:hypothetical protein